MRKLLTTLFAVFVVVSAFAQTQYVDVTTTSPDIEKNSTCYPAGILTLGSSSNHFTAPTSGNVYLVRVTLDETELCKVIGYKVTNGYRWIDLKDLNSSYGGNAGEVYVLGIPGTTHIWVAITSSYGGYPIDIASTENGSRETAICVNAHDSGISLNDRIKIFFSVYETADSNFDFANDVLANEDDLQLLAGGSPVVNATFNPSDPTIGYMTHVPQDTVSLEVGEQCYKEGSAVDFGSLPASDTIYKCPCYGSSSEQDPNTGEYHTTYDCSATWRVGDMIFRNISGDNGCELYLEESEIGTLEDGDLLILTVTDENGNPIVASNGSHYQAGFAVDAGDSLPTLTTDVTSGLAITYVGAAPNDMSGHDLPSLESSSDNYLGASDCSDRSVDNCEDNYDIYDSITYQVTSSSSASNGIIYLPNFMVGILSSSNYVGNLYLTVTVVRQGTCGDMPTVITIHDVFVPVVDCQPEPVTPPSYYQDALYFPYFPNTGYWWSGLAITNVNYFYNTVVPSLLDYWSETNIGADSINGVDQDINVALYLIEEDGDVYVYDAGTLPKSGILTVLLSDPAFSPVLMNGYTDDAFGDERFWVVAVGTATVANTPIVLDGFGMLGDGTQGQGFLPRIPTYINAAVGSYYGNLNNK